jgi:CheY-like chemotaxis protein
MESRRRRVLLLDDDELIRWFLSEIFKQRGYEVLAFPEPRVCPLSSAHGCPCENFTDCVDLIVSDVNMLGANGIDFVEALLAQGCRVHSIALMSGAFSDEDLARTSRLNCAAFPKPLDMPAFLDWVSGVERSMPSKFPPIQEEGVLED